MNPDKEILTHPWLHPIYRFAWNSRARVDSSRRGITRLEVVVMLVLCFITAGVGMILLARHRESAQRVQCEERLRRIGQAFYGYHSASSAEEASQHLPPSRIADGYATWAVLLAPYLIDQHPLTQWDVQQSYFAQKAEVRDSLMLFYFCPARPRSDRLSQAGDVDAANKHFPGGLGDYACVAGDGSEDHDWTGPNANGPLVIAEVLERKGDRILKWQSRTSLAQLERHRGKSYTLLVGEKHVPLDHEGDAAFGDGSFYNGQHPASFSRVAGPGFPIAPSPNAPFNKNFGSAHNGICNFLLADSSRRALAINTSEHVLGEMARRGD